jgi:peptidoglycan/xylan/chitin deacetylase (PgdA/CDA1 family)
MSAVIQSLRPGWFDGRKFALFLSHDIDQIHDRELFHLLATVNHIRRMVTQGESGSVKLALRRLARILLAPKEPESDFRTILEIEQRHGFKSTFFVLHDPYWSRHGPRYTLQSKALKRIARLIRDADGEIGAHGGYRRFNQAAGYRESREALCQALGGEVKGIRNHHLRFSYPETWLAQKAAGFRYDATFGSVDRLGNREDRWFPFYPIDPASDRELDLVALPLTVMDVVIFRHLKLSGEAALAAAWQAIEPVIEKGGLVSLLWHNNYFNDPEYRDWQWVYEQLLQRLAALKPWCATGEEIAEWWRSEV